MTGNADSIGQVRRGRIRSTRPVPSRADAELLGEYRAALRVELRAVLQELMPGMEPGLFVPNVTRPPLDKRVQLWGLADRLARNLAGMELVEPEEDRRDRAPAPRRQSRPGRIAGL